MAKIIDVTNALFDSANTVANVYDDYTSKQAELSTRTKSYQLQEAITGELNRIKQDSHFENWNTEINNFFERIKGNMSNPDSPYYCRNNLQAQMFNNILEQNQQSVNEHVSGLVIQRQQEKNIVDTENAIEQVFQMYAGPEAVERSNELVKSLYETGAINLTQYDARKDSIYKRAYEDMHTKLFDGSFNAALAQNKTKEAFWEDIKNSVPRLKATDTYGLEKSIDMTATDEALKKQAYQYYEARLSDVQNANAGKLSEIVQEMRQQKTLEGKISVAEKGFNTMDKMMGLNLSTSQRDHYSSIFEFTVSQITKGSGGSTKQSDYDKFENLIKTRGDLALQVWMEGLNGNMYDITDRLSQEYTKQWFNKPWQENWNKSESESEFTFDYRFAAQVSPEGLVEAAQDKLLSKYPEIKDKLGSEFTALRKDMQKNPDQYGTDNVEKMGYWLLDAIYSADPNVTTSKDILDQWEKYKNDCYLERVKYVELKNINDPNSLVKKFDATKPDQIAQAARLAMEKDYVYTWQGKEFWADGKKEALEAPGGIINVMQNGLVGTLDIPQSDIEAGKVGFKYEQTDYDMTSKPIFTYNGHEFEVVPNDDNKGFKVVEYSVDQKGNRQFVQEYAGKIGGKGKKEREEEKQQAQQTVNTNHGKTASIEQQRADTTNAGINAAVEMPKAMKSAGKVKDAEWNTSAGDLSTRQIYLQDTVSAIDKDAKKIKNKKKDAMTKDDFEKKYGISYADWMETSQVNKRFDLILNSK